MSSNQQPPGDKQWNTALYDGKATLFGSTDAALSSYLPRGRENESLTSAAELAIAAVEDRLRSQLFRDGSWYADYRWIRIAATKERPGDS